MQTSIATFKSQLDQRIAANGWADIPHQFVTKEGHLVNSEGDSWVIATPSKVVNCDFKRIENSVLRWALKRYVMMCAQAISAHAATAIYFDFSAEVISRMERFDLVGECDLTPLCERLISLMNDMVADAKLKLRLWALYRVIRWYIWCAYHFASLGFSEQLASELDRMKIPGNPKGYAVRDEDPEAGPLDGSLELPLILDALKTDSSAEFEHLQQKAAVALSVAFGRNPANLVFLNEEDLVNLTADIADIEPCYRISMPRIKKGQDDPRADFKEETLEATFATHVLALIDANQGRTAKVMTENGVMTTDVRPLFVNQQLNRKPVPVSAAHRKFRVPSTFISSALKRFVERHSILSPVTKMPLNVSTRRFRYTMASSLADSGASAKELARILDHSDTQHVQVYYELKNRIIAHLDKAQAKELGALLGLFKGKLISSEIEAETSGRSDKDLFFFGESSSTDQLDIGKCGKKVLCGLDPPFSCYLCPKFRPYWHANHEKVLESLLTEREERLKKYEAARLGIQLDEVIFAVGQVAALCEGEGQA